MPDAKIIESPMLKRRKEEAKRLADRYITPDGSAPTPEALQSAIVDAAKLDKTSYELERRDLAARFDEVAEEEAVEPFLAPDEPWEEAVAGSEHLRQHPALSHHATARGTRLRTVGSVCAHP
jgi:hypothetical protein